MSARLDLNNQIARVVIELQPALLAMRHEFHRLPEVGWVEYGTASRVCEELSRLGFVVRTGRDVIVDDHRLGVPDNNLLETAYENAVAAGAPMPWIELMRGGFTGVLADLDTRRPGPCLAFRFDLDALPIHEASDSQHRPADEGWASTSVSAMHACGHDGHISIGLSLARLIINLAPHLCGRIRLVFQPAEEGVRGAAAMSTVCEGVDKLLCLHLVRKHAWR